jgi:alkylation response protein AidB-like acyl-CoA dehydrogenase
MDLSYSPDEIALRDEIRAGLSQIVTADLAARVAAGAELTKPDMEGFHAALDARGWLTGHWPAQHGGLGWGPVQRHIFEEECYTANAPRIVPFGVTMLAPVLMKFGTPEQSATLLPRIRSGADWWCQGYSEPGAGSDLASLRCKAERDGDAYIVTGQKTWTTLAQHANKIFCLVRTSAQGKPQAGISFLLMDMDAPGVTCRPIRTLDGGHEINEVFFDGVRVPVANRVSAENEGWTIAKYLLNHERTNIAMVGASTVALEQLKRLARATSRSGQPLIRNPLFAARIAEVETDLEAHRITNLRMLAEAQAKGAPGPEVSMLKITGTRIRQTINDLARRALGPAAAPFPSEALTGNAALTDPEHAAHAARYFNNRKVSIYGGSNEIQANILAKHVLEL